VYLVRLLVSEQDWRIGHTDRIAVSAIAEIIDFFMMGFSFARYITSFSTPKRSPNRNGKLRTGLLRPSLLNLEFFVVERNAVKD
jgi:hypothetical protein